MNLNHDHGGHRLRLKQRFLKEGNFDNFEPHNILEYLLFNTIPIRDTNDTAHRLLKHFGSLSAVFDAPYSELVKIEGIGPHTATLIKAVLPMARAYSRDKDNVGVILDCTDKYIEFIKEKYIGYNEEVFSIVCMDNSYKVLSYEVITTGNVDMVHMDTRKMLEVILRTNATCVVAVHNPPGGLAFPSEADKAATKTIGLACVSVGVDLIDHVIIAKGDAVSLWDSRICIESFKRGWMK